MVWGGAGALYAGDLGLGACDLLGVEGGGLVGGVCWFGRGRGRGEEDVLRGRIVGVVGCLWRFFWFWLFYCFGFEEGGWCGGRGKESR